MRCGPSKYLGRIQGIRKPDVQWRVRISHLHVWARVSITSYTVRYIIDKYFDLANVHRIGKGPTDVVSNGAKMTGIA
jgi:hypothetical protein